MKKTWVFIACVACLVVGTVLGLVWDTAKDKQDEQTEPVTVEFVQRESLDSVNVARAFQLDNEYLFVKYADKNAKIRWFESCYKMSDFLDAEQTPVVAGVANVFQVQVKQNGGTRVTVYAFGHTKEGVEIKIADNNFWIEDYDLFEYDDTLLTFDEAYDWFLKANCRKPHSKNVTLRWQIGPNPKNEYNPQYIFGKPDDKWFVDAHTGDVRSDNPSGVPEGGSEPY